MSKLFYTTQSQIRTYGATMVEFSLAAGVLIFFLIGLVDIFRYLAVKALLMKGANEGLNVARKIYAYETDIRGLDASVPEQLEKLHEFINARNDIIAAAIRLPTSVFVGGSSSSNAIKLKAFDITHTDEVSNVTADVLVLRPGERARLDGVDIDHPTVCSHGSASVACASWLALTNNYETIMRNNPIIVELRATVPLWFPMGGEVTVRSRAIGYREVPPRGSYTMPVTSSTSTLFDCESWGPPGSFRRNWCINNGCRIWVSAATNHQNCCIDRNPLPCDDQACNWTIIHKGCGGGTWFDDREWPNCCELPPTTTSTTSTSIPPLCSSRSNRDAEEDACELCGRIWHDENFSPGCCVGPPVPCSDADCPWLEAPRDNCSGTWNDSNNHPNCCQPPPTTTTTIILCGDADESEIEDCINGGGNWNYGGSAPCCRGGDD